MIKLNTIFPLALATAALPLAGKLQAATYTEMGDAGDLPGSAQVVTGVVGAPLTQIGGVLTLSSSLSDSDMFQIYISNPAAFSASTTAFVAGANNFDTQIFLFNSSGRGVIGNDDAASGALSSIPAGSFTSSAGYYYLLISGSGRYATSVGGLIFPNYTDGTTDPTLAVGPTGPGGGSTITGYTGNSNDGGNYRIDLTGAQFAVAPEPSTWAFILAGTAGLAGIARLRRCA